MTALTDLISAGGGGGALIGEYVGFADQGVSFTDANSHVWLRSGSGSFDTTTYPDALTEDKYVSTSNEFQSDDAFVSDAWGGICRSGDWVIALNTSSNRTYSMMNLATNTVVAQGANLPGSSTSWDMGLIGYITASSSSPDSEIANCDNKFAVAAFQTGANQGWYLDSYRLDGYNSSSDIGNGTPQSKRQRVNLYRPNGSVWTTNRTDSRGGMHWANSKLYIMISDQTNGGTLLIYDFTGSAFGSTSLLFTGTTSNGSITAATEIDYASESTVLYCYALTGSSTDLYIKYYHNTDNYVKIRKIPLSGDLSWSSGSDVGLTDQTPSPVNVEDSSGNITAENMDLFGLGFSEMDGSTPKFLNAITSGGRLIEFKAGEVIGSTTTTQVGPATGVTFYQRIK
jgi:hypothetical protein